jgi:hypothetical protein
MCRVVALLPIKYALEVLTVRYLCVLMFRRTNITDFMQQNSNLCNWDIINL